MKNRKLKKGFTLVELIVVIAIIAILAAVSVVSYLAFVRQANESADIQLVKQLNTSLQGDEALNGKRSTMHDMLGAMEENGFVVENLAKTKSGYDIVWDQENNRFGLLDKDKVVYGEDSFKITDSNKYNFWKFADTLAEAKEQEYSVYLTEEFSKVEITDGVLLIKGGIDTGLNTVENIKYTGTTAKNGIVFNTNGGKLTIDAENDIVKHYGFAKSVDIKAVAPDSYHEFGEVGFTQIAQGHYVAEEGAKVNVLLATGRKTEVKIDNNGAEIQKAYTTEKSAEDKNHGGNESLDYYEVKISADATDEQKAAAIEEAIETLETGATMFAGGTGTENDPFLVYDYETMQNISKFYDDSDARKVNYFKVKDGITTIDCNETGKGWVSVNLLGSFDGNGVTFNNLNKALFSEVNNVGSDYETNAITIKNINIKANIVTSTASALICNLYRSYINNLHLIIDGVNVEGYIEGSGGASSYIVYGPYYSTYKTLSTPSITFKNCISTATVVATGDNAAGFVKHGANAYFKIEDSLFLGTLSDTQNNSGYFNANNTKQFHAQVSYSDGFLASHGITNDSDLYNYPTGGTLEKVDADSNNWTAKSRTQLNKSAQSLPNDAKFGDKIAITKTTNASKAIVTLWIAPNDTNNQGSYLSCYMSETIDLSTGNSFTTDQIRYFDVQINGNAAVATKTVGNSGYSADAKVFNVINSVYGNTYNAAYVQIVQYGENGSILSIQTVNIAVAK